LDFGAIPVPETRSLRGWVRKWIPHWSWQFWPKGNLMRLSCWSRRIAGCGIPKLNSGKQLMHQSRDTPLNSLGDVDGAGKELALIGKNTLAEQRAEAQHNQEFGYWAI
jgi:hypothetical protein